jgi:2-dehydro-3-deoxygluconokinase
MSRVVTLGEIMARLAAPGHLRFQQAMPGSLEVTFAGAEANVAMSIAHLGGEAVFVTALPDHPIADACVANLRAVGVGTQHIVRTAEGRLGLYFLETGANQRAGLVIYDREGSSMAVTPASAYDWEGIFEGAEWLLISGITPAISQTAAEVARVAMEQASSRGVKVACDMNFRQKLWRWEPGVPAHTLATRTMRQLMPWVDLFIGGREDAVQMLGLDVESLEPVEVARRIIQEYPRIRRVAMTLREGISATHNNWSGLLYVADTDTAFQAPLRDGILEPYEIRDMVDRLGGGDAFTAGLLFALTAPDLQAPGDALAFAVAASCLAHSIQGDFNFSTRAEVEALMSGDSSGRVKR